MSKQYNCPDCRRTDSCDGCYRVVYLPVNLHYNESSIFCPHPCRGCGNNPNNGGSGVCNCILGTQKIT